MSNCSFNWTSTQMPPTTRLSPLAVASSLLRSLRTRPLLYSLRGPSQTLRRPPQCRPISLYKFVRQNALLGGHKSLTYEPYALPPPNTTSHTVDIWSRRLNGERIATGVSLAKLTRTYVRPGIALIPLDAVPMKKVPDIVGKLKEADAHNQYNGYYLAELEKKSVSEEKIEPHENVVYTNLQASGLIKSLKALKQIRLLASTPVDHFVHRLKSAYSFLQMGHTVEFGMRIPGPKLDKKQRLEGGPHDDWTWLHNHFPHMRPNIILAAMPKGTFFTVAPFCDGRNIQFVLAVPVLNRSTSEVQRQVWTQKLLQKKQMVKASIKAGTQQELPKQMRQNLVDQGSDLYSIDTGRPRLAEPRKEKSPWDWRKVLGKEKPRREYPRMEHPGMEHPGIEHPGMEKPIMKPNDALYIRNKFQKTARWYMQQGKLLADREDRILNERARPWQWADPESISRGEEIRKSKEKESGLRRGQDTISLDRD
jgi:hypothetical protein